jgi:hypothetical protein
VNISWAVRSWSRASRRRRSRPAIRRTADRRGRARADASAAEPGDRFAVKSLGGLALAQQRSRARLDPKRRVGATRKARHELLKQGYRPTVVQLPLKLAVEDQASSDAGPDPHPKYVLVGAAGASAILARTPTRTSLSIVTSSPPCSPGDERAKIHRPLNPGTSCRRARRGAATRCSRWAWSLSVVRYGEAGLSVFGGVTGMRWTSSPRATRTSETSSGGNRPCSTTPTVAESCAASCAGSSNAPV